LNRIEDYQAFVAIIEKRSLTAAAHHLRRSLQSVSRSLAALEHDIGIELIRRTTRRLSPTDAGLAFYRRLSAALAEIEAAKLETSNRRAEATGLLRIAGSTVFSPHYVVPALTEFLMAHPRVEVELELSDGYVDLIGEGYDLAIRIGELPDSTLKSKLLAKSRRVVFGAPSYFAKYGRPESPEDLLRHQCIIRTAARDANAWPFKLNGRLKTVKVAGRLRTSGALADRGDAEVILTGFEPPPTAIHAVWPATRVLPARTQFFIEFLAKHLQKQQL